MNKGFSLKNIVIAAVSLLTILGAFLPWATVKVLMLEKTLNGISNETGVADGIFFVIGAVITIVLTIVFIKKEDLSTGTKCAVSILNVLLTILAIAKIVDVNSVPLTTVGAGLYILIASTAITAVLPWVPYNKMLGK